MLKKVKEFGVNKWASIAAFLPDRSDIQCRYHFNRFYRSPFVRFFFYLQLLFKLTK